MAFLRTLFSATGLLIGIYILIGVFFNTAPPHIPTTPSALSSLHSWVQYIISVLFWPLALWHPTFTLGQWTPLSFMAMIVERMRSSVGCGSDGASSRQSDFISGRDVPRGWP